MCVNLHATGAWAELVRLPWVHKFSASKLENTCMAEARNSAVYFCQPLQAPSQHLEVHVFQ